jgi:hypothetical protein
MFIPGAIVMPGIGAVGGAGDDFAGAGAGVLFCLGAGVAGIPGIGAIVGCAESAGDAVKAIENAAMAKRVASKGYL